jgi:hypothetical protein
MANHVTFRANFEQINKAALAKLKDLYSRFQDSNCNFGDMFVDDKEGSPTYEETNSRSWYNENVGAKWCYLEEYDDDYLFGTSAWAAPEAGLQWLADQLGELDPNLLMNVSFEDEGPNFVGWMVFDGTELWDVGFEEDEDVKNIVSRYSPDTNLEDEDEYHEALWESIYDWQRDNFNRVEKEIINSRALLDD